MFWSFSRQHRLKAAALAVLGFELATFLSQAQHLLSLEYKSHNLQSLPKQTHSHFILGDKMPRNVLHTWLPRFFSPLLTVPSRAMVCLTAAPIQDPQPALTITVWIQCSLDVKPPTQTEYSEQQLHPTNSSASAKQINPGQRNNPQCIAFNIDLAFKIQRPYLKRWLRLMTNEKEGERDSEREGWVRRMIQPK